MNFFEPFAVTIDGKTTTFKDATEFWNWCIKNKPDWVRIPNSKSRIYRELEDCYKNLSSGVDIVKTTLDEESYSNYI